MGGTLESCPDSTPISSTTSIPSTPSQIVFSPTKSSYEQESSFIRFQTIQRRGHSSIVNGRVVFLPSPVWVARLESFCFDIIWFLDRIHTPILSTRAANLIVDCAQRHQNSSTEIHDIVSFRNPSKNQ